MYIHIAELLYQFKYDQDETAYLLNGFTKEFELGYEGAEDCTLTARNLPLKCGMLQDVWDKMMKETKLKHFAGPFQTIPFKYYIQSPTGLVPKDQGKQTRLVFYLSFHDQSSVNYNTPKHKCRVKYKDLEHAVKLCLEAGKGCYVVKSDLKSALRNFPTRKQDWRWLVMMAQHPCMHKKYYFVDKCMPLGLLP